MIIESEAAVASVAATQWWRGATIYQIYPRSFAESNGDGIGDLPGITAHLEYVAALGVDAIWLSPFFTSPMRDFGYDVADYRDVDPIFGTLGDFDQLVHRAHQLKLRVIIDQVYSHTSDQHSWFQQSRADRTNARANWYVWADAKADGTPPSNWQSVFGGPAWAWDARRRQYYLHNFLAEQPDLNVHNPQVRAALLDCGRFWLDRGVDGFRLDAINFAMHDPMLRDNPPAPTDCRRRTRPLDFQQPLHNKSHRDLPQFIEQIRALTDSYADRFTVAEVGGAADDAEMQRYTAGNRRFHSAYGFKFLDAEQLTPAVVRTALEAWPDAAGSGWPSWAFSNHDVPRAVSRWAAPEERDAIARLAMLLLVSLRGNIFIYQGEELGLTQARIGFRELQDPEAIANWPLTLGRDGARTPQPWQSAAANAGFSTARPWLPVGAEHAALAVDTQCQDPNSQLALTRRLIAFRRRHPALRTGSLRFIDSGQDVLTFERRAGPQTLLCTFNLGRTTRNWQPESGKRWQLLEQVGAAAGSTMPPLSGLIAEQLP